MVSAYKLLISSSRSVLRAFQELEPREDKKVFKIECYQSSLPGGNPRNIVVFRQYKAKLEQYII